MSSRTSSAQIPPVMRCSPVTYVRTRLRVCSVVDSISLLLMQPQGYKGLPNNFDTDDEIDDGQCGVNHSPR